MNRFLAIVLVGFAACTPAGKPGGPEANPESPSRQPEAQDTSEIEQVVRDFFDAFRDSDYSEWRDLSIGELRDLAEWQALISAGNVSSDRELTVDSLEVIQVTDDEAEVELVAQFTETFVDPLSQGEDTYTLDLSGPISLVRAGEGWRVADFFRNGRQRTASVFTDVTGHQDVDGVVVDVVGADLRDEVTVVVVRIRNTTPDSIDLDFDASIVTQRGRQFGMGVPTQTDVAPRATLEEVYYWDNTELPLDTRQFRLLMDFFSESGFDEISFDIPVALVD